MKFINNNIETLPSIGLAQYGLFLLIGVLIAIGVLFLSTEAMFLILSAVILFMVGWVVVLAWSKNIADHLEVRFIKRIFLLSFFIRAGAVFILYAANLAYDLPLFAAEYGGFFADDLNYHERSIEIAGLIEAYGFYAGFERSIFYYMGNFGYGYLNAIIYYFLNGPSTLVIRIVNCFFGALTPMLCFMIARSVYKNSKIARNSAILTAIFPTFIVLSSVQYKDTIVIFMTLYVIWVSLQIRERLFLKDIGLFLLSVSMLAIFRSTIAVALLAIIAIYFILQRKIRTFSVSLSVITLFAGFIILYLLSTQELLRFYELSTMYELSQHLTHSYIQNADTTSLISRVSEAGVGRLYLTLFNIILFLVAPLPNADLGIFTPILLGVWLWYLLIPASAYGLIYSMRAKSKGSWILYMLVYTVFIMIIASYLASNFRYRAQIMPILLMFSSVGIFHFKKIKHVYIIYLVAMPLFGLAYLYIKYYA